MLDNTPNQPIKFITKNCFEINDNTRGTYNTNSQITFKTLMLKSSFCDHSDAYILFKETISVAAQAGANPNNEDKEVVFKNCAPFTDYISKINNKQVDNAKDIDIVLPKPPGSLWQYYRDEPTLTNAGDIANFHAANNSASFQFKQKITG